MVGFRNNFSKCREAIYLDRFQIRMPILRSSFDVSVSGILVNELTSWLTWRTLRTIANPLRVHARALEVYIHFALMYATDYIFPILPIKDLINKDVNPTTPFKLSTGTKPSVSHLRVLFCPCVSRKSTAHVNKKALNIPQQARKIFCGIFVGIPQHQKG